MITSEDDINLSVLLVDFTKKCKELETRLDNLTVEELYKFTKRKIRQTNIHAGNYRENCDSNEVMDLLCGQLNPQYNSKVANNRILNTQADFEIEFEDELKKLANSNRQYNEPYNAINIYRNILTIFQKYNNSSIFDKISKNKTLKKITLYNRPLYDFYVLTNQYTGAYMENYSFDYEYEDNKRYYIPEKYKIYLYIAAFIDSNIKYLKNKFVYILATKFNIFGNAVDEIYGASDEDSDDEDSTSDEEYGGGIYGGGKFEYIDFYKDNMKYIKIKIDKFKNIIKPFLDYDKNLEIYYKTYGSLYKTTVNNPDIIRNISEFSGYKFNPNVEKHVENIHSKLDEKVKLRKKAASVPTAPPKESRVSAFTRSARTAAQSAAQSTRGFVNSIRIMTRRNRQQEETQNPMIPNQNKPNVGGRKQKTRKNKGRKTGKK